MNKQTKQTLLIIILQIICLIFYAIFVRYAPEVYDEAPKANSNCILISIKIIKIKKLISIKFRGNC